MRYLVLSDIHANMEALDAVIREAGAYDAALVLGDLVGYGPDPNAVVERIRGLNVAALIRGNHDKVAVGIDSSESFNYLAREAIAWTGNTLTDANRAWVAALPAGPVTVDGHVEICHGTPFDEDVYVFDDLDAIRALRAASAPLCLFGHTHVPAAYRLSEALHTIGPPRGDRFYLTLDDEARFLVNCGAVGQPRDGDPRAAGGVLDTAARTLTVMRVAYDVGATQRKILEAGLPEVLAQRLAIGR